MAPLLQRLRSWLTEGTTLYECRSCGTTLEEQQNTCPQCGAEDIARYNLD